MASGRLLPLRRVTSSGVGVVGRTHARGHREGQEDDVEHLDPGVEPFAEPNRALEGGARELREVHRAEDAIDLDPGRCHGPPPTSIPVQGRCRGPSGKTGSSSPSSPRVPKRLRSPPASDRKVCAVPREGQPGFQGFFRRGAGTSCGRPRPAKGDFHARELQSSPRSRPGPPWPP